MSNDDSKLYDFGPFRLDVAERQLLRDGVAVPLTGKAFEVLHLLVRNSERTVLKDEFMTEVWAGTVVEEANLTDNISTLRQLLGDDAREPRYIRTVPRRGYRFVADVRDGTSADSPETRLPPVAPLPRRKWTAIAAAAVAILSALFVVMRPRSERSPAPTSSTPAALRSLAVMPFKPLTPADRDPAIEMGMTDALIGKLSRLESLTVRPTTSVLPYVEKAVDTREVAATLGVDAILEGKIQKSGDRVRVSVQLIRAADGATTWGDRFDERFTDIFALQDAISERVAAALAVRLTAGDRKSLTRRPTENIEAYQLYLNGRHQWRSFSDAGLLASINYYNAALKLDPGFARAWAGLSGSYSVIGIWGPMTAIEVAPKAVAAANKAVALDPASAEAYVSLVVVKLLYERDWAGARRGLETITQLDEQNPDLQTMRGYYHQAMGEADQALPYLLRARDLQPEWRIAKNDALDALIDARRFDEAIVESRKAIALDPSQTTPHTDLGAALAARGDYAAALEPYTKVVELTRRESVRHLTGLAWLHAKAGRKAEALKLMSEAEQMPNAGPWSEISLARVHIALGDHDRAFALLNQAADEKFPFLWDIRNRFEFDPIRNDPRYKQVLARIGL